jgi:hypothetical protein
MQTSRQVLGRFGETIVAKKCACPKYKRSQSLTTNSFLQAYWVRRGGLRKIEWRRQSTSHYSSS